MSPQKSTFGDADDESWGNPPRQKSEMDLDITPMIDVTFLLLIFFMVTSTMQSEKDLDVPVARHGIGVETKGATIVEIRNSGGVGSAQPTIVLVGGNNQNATTDQVRDFVQERLQAGHFDVIIKADREVPHGFVHEVTKSVNLVEGVKFYFGVQDKPTY